MPQSRREVYNISFPSGGVHLIERAFLKHQAQKANVRKPPPDIGLIFPDHVEAAIFFGKGGQHISEKLRYQIAKAITQGDLSLVNLTAQQIIDLVNNKP